MPSTESNSSESLAVRVPLAIKKRGGRKIVVSPDGQQTWAPTRPRVDNTLLRAVVQAFHWKDLLEKGQFATVSELAEAEKLNTSYVSHVLRLTLLAPDLVEAVLDGRQPPTMQLQPLVRQIECDWLRQRRAWI
ncbi:hypothetical protein [Mesorhizobium sp. L-8-3]|uniref:hypothetical protein n=1 Tax=Mesorhizobium sp. L-8-3 TaxID=2744522 RepID=UPI001927B4F1|nr:hypothetical protein [Mesorhizobium sp. L-8-3]BCH23563.1 hypothetical protein MesoLjLb_33480 [Mesorhizobium sp. L-8-3]